MRVLRPFLRRPAVQATLCWIIAQYVRLVRWSGKWTFIGEETPNALSEAGKPFILAFWHGRLLMMPYAWRGRESVNMLISSHPDGRLIARTMDHFRIATVAGSTAKGATAATRTLLRVLRKGGVVGITPDGPRGPYMRASDGVVALARISGAPILPVSAASSRRVVLGSWDRFVLSLPFGRGVFIWGAPIHVPRDADAALLAAKRVAVEDALNAATKRADSMMGQPVIAPTPIKDTADTDITNADMTPAAAER